MITRSFLPSLKSIENEPEPQVVVFFFFLHHNTEDLVSVQTLYVFTRGQQNPVLVLGEAPKWWSSVDYWREQKYYGSHYRSWNEMVTPSFIIIIIISKAPNRAMCIPLHLYFILHLYCTFYTYKNTISVQHRRRHRHYMILESSTSSPCSYGNDIIFNPCVSELQNGGADSRADKHLHVKLHVIQWWVISSLQKHSVSQLISLKES